MISFSLTATAQFEKKILKAIEKSAVFLPSDTLTISQVDLFVGANSDSLFGNLTLGTHGWPEYYVNLEGGNAPRNITDGTGFTHEFPATIQVKVGGLYINSFEVSHGQYKAFVEWTRINNPDQLQEVFVDSQGWKIANSFNSQMMTYYHTHPAYDNYPLVNISHENAERYLSWLTNEYNKSPKRKYKKVLFRLPTEAEWMYAYLGGQSSHQATYYQSFRRPNGQLTANFITVPQANIIKLQGGKNVQISDTSMKTTFTYRSYSTSNTDTLDTAYTVPPNLFIFSAANPWADDFQSSFDYTTPIKSYWPNKWGIYTMAGNVAEFVAMDGIAKGGHWNTTAFYLLPNSRETFDEQNSSSPTRGFRWVMEIIEE